MTPLPPPHPPGWYPDPWASDGLRYYDGRTWTVRHAVPTAATIPPPPHPVLPIEIAVGAILVLGASLIAGRIVLSALVDHTDWPVVAYVATSAVIGYGPSLVWGRYAVARWKPGTGPLEAVGPRVRWLDLPWGLLVWLAAVGAQIAMAAFVLVTRIPITPNTEGIRDLDVDRTVVITQLVLAVVAAPLVEEYVFRGLVLRGLLSRVGPVAAIGIQGVLFGSAHIGPERGVGNIGLVLVLSTVGTAFGAGAYLLKRVPPTVVAHAVFNAVVMTIVLTR